MRIGRDVMNLNWDNQQREKRWTGLCAEMLGGEQYVRTVTALLNLDSRHAPDQKRVPDKDLLNGFVRYVWPLLSELRPRLVCALA